MSHKSREVVAATDALCESVGLLLIIRPTYIVGPHLGQRFLLLVRDTRVGVGTVAGDIHVEACDREDERC